MSQFKRAMDEKDETRLRRFEVMLHQLMGKYHTLMQDNELLHKRLAEKEQALENLSARLKEKQEQYDRLKTTLTIEASARDIRDARSALSGLVREIDKCIALLNE